MAASARRWRATVVGVIAGITLPLSALAEPVAADPDGATTPSVAQAVAQKVAPAVRKEIAEEGKSTFWVVLDKKADLGPARAKTTKAEKGAEVYRALTEFAEASQAPLRKLLDSTKADYTPFWISNTIKVTGDAKLLGELAARSEVKQVSADVILPAPKPAEQNLKPLGEVNGVEWNINNVKAPRVWNELGVRGEGITVASIDTGAELAHPALNAKYRGKSADGTYDHNYNWFDPANVCATKAPCDNPSASNPGHGTHTMGTMVGDDGTNQIGVAPGARWIAAKGCEATASVGCSETSLISSGQWILAPTDLNGANPRPDLAPDVVNNSWGNTLSGVDLWYSDIVNAWVAAGIFPSWANGNSGPGCTSTNSPGAYANSYSSGAVDINNVIASFSSRGSGEAGDVKPNLSAPGVNVRSAIPGGYSSLSGTSMATPHTSGVVALILSASPALVGNVAETRRILDSTAIDVNDTSCGGTAADNLTYGEGLLDAYAAVSAAPRGPVGALGGAVTSGGDALSGATITAEGPINRTAYTGADGRYAIPNLSVGEYTIKASKYGYTTATGTVTIAEGATATLDLALTQAPSATLSGTVSTSAGPAAGAALEFVGTPLTTKTDSQGRYSVTAPLGEYDIRVTVSSRCADAVTQRVNLTADTTRDITLPDRIDGFGYACGAASGSYPTVTTKFDLTGDDAVKAVDLPFAVPFYGVAYNKATISTNGALIFGTASNTGVNAAIPSASNPNGALFPFWDDLRVDDDSGIYTGVVGTAPHRQYVVEWRNVNHYTDATQKLSFVAAIGEDGSIVYRYKDVAGVGLEAGSSASIGLENPTGTVGFSYSYNTAVVNGDLALAFRTTKSGVVRGKVLDGNDGTGVVGATVTAKSGDTVVGTTTTAGDGSYLLTAAVGDVAITAEMTNYETKTGTATITPGGVATHDATLRTGRVSTSKEYVEIVVPTGESRNRAIELSNTGTLEASYTISEASGGEPGDVPWLATLNGTGVLKPGEKSSLLLTVNTANLAPGTAHNGEVRITSNSGRTPVLSLPVRLVVPGFQAAIDAGSQRPHIDADGDSWTADRQHTAGACGYLANSTSVVTTRKPIAGTTDQTRFADARQGAYEYRCDGLANGVYTVELDFAELKNTKPDKRVFDVLIEDVEVLPSLDIAGGVGSFAALSRTYTVRVTDGALNVRFVTHGGFGKPLVNALRITNRPDKTA